MAAEELSPLDATMLIMRQDAAHHRMSKKARMLLNLPLWIQSIFLALLVSALAIVLQGLRLSETFSLATHAVGFVVLFLPSAAIFLALRIGLYSDGGPGRIRRATVSLGVIAIAFAAMFAAEFYYTGQAEISDDSLFFLTLYLVLTTLFAFLFGREAPDPELTPPDSAAGRGSG